MRLRSTIVPKASECYLPVMRKWTDPIVYSHVLFLVNAAIWCAAGAWPAGAAMVLTCIASTTYHRKYEVEGIWQTIDMVCATITLGFTLYLTVPLMSSLQIVEATTLLLSAFLAKHVGGAYHYRSWHTVWHGLVALGQAFLAWVYWTGTS